MSNPKLPEALRGRIIQLFLHSWSFDDVIEEVRKKALQYVDSNQEVRNCVRRLKAEATRRRNRGDLLKPLDVATVPSAKGGEQAPVLKGRTIKARCLERPANGSIKVGLFDTDKHGHLRRRILATGRNNIAKEPYFKMVARDVLENKEGFSPVIESTGQGVPFDFLAIKEGKPVLIELKGSLKEPHIPDDVQLVRMQHFLNLLHDIEIELYLIQIHFDRGEYYLWYPEAVRFLFGDRDQSSGKYKSLRPTADWVRCRLREVGDEYQIVEQSKCQYPETEKGVQEEIPISKRRCGNQTEDVIHFGNIIHPPYYVQRQVMPNLSKNKMDTEVVWTYLLARKYKDDLPGLTRLLCGPGLVPPENGRIWLEAYLHPTRKRSKEKRCWKTRADLSIGHIKQVPNRKLQIQANGRWIAVAEAKWFDDIHPNSCFPEICQLAQIIDHTLLMHDGRSQFPEQVFVTLITPKYFTDPQNDFAQRAYYETFRKYLTDNEAIKNDLSRCPLPFLEFDLQTLLDRVEALRLNWITFEEALGLPDLVEPCVPGKYRVSRTTWQEVLLEMDRMDLWTELREGL